MSTHNRQEARGSMASSLPAVVVIAASAGGVQALITLVGALPADLDAAVVVLLHRPADVQSHLIPILRRRSVLPVLEATEGATVRPGTVYVARADRHLHFSQAGRIGYSDGRRIRHVLASANPLFETTAHVFGRRAIGVVLTGTGCDATDGVQALKAHGGVVIAQDPATAEHAGMPTSAVATGVVDYVLPLEEIAPALQRLIGPAAAASAAETI